MGDPLTGPTLCAVSPRRMIEVVEELARNSPTLFTTAENSRIREISYAYEKLDTEG